MTKLKRKHVNTTYFTTSDSRKAVLIPLKGNNCYSIHLSRPVSELRVPSEWIYHRVEF